MLLQAREAGHQGVDQAHEGFTQGVDYAHQQYQQGVDQAAQTGAKAVCVGAPLSVSQVQSCTVVPTAALLKTLRPPSACLTFYLYIPHSSAEINGGLWLTVTLYPLWHQNPFCVMGLLDTM